MSLIVECDDPIQREILLEVLERARKGSADGIDNSPASGAFWQETAHNLLRRHGTDAERLAWALAGAWTSGCFDGIQRSRAADELFERAAKLLARYRESATHVRDLSGAGLEVEERAALDRAQAVLEELDGDVVLVEALARKRGVIP